MLLACKNYQAIMSCITFVLRLILTQSLHLNHTKVSFQVMAVVERKPYTRHCHKMDGSIKRKIQMDKWCLVKLVLSPRDSHKLKVWIPVKKMHPQKGQKSFNFFLHMQIIIIFFFQQMDVKRDFRSGENKELVFVYFLVLKNPNPYKHHKKLHGLK